MLLRRGISGRPATCHTAPGKKKFNISDLSDLKIYTEQSEKDHDFIEIY